MSRIYSRKKGKSSSTKPVIIKPKKWTKMTKNEIEAIIVKLAKERKTSAQIGTILRDMYGVPDIKAATDKKLNAILKEHDVYPDLPDDMMSLLRKSVQLRTHLESNRSDKHSKKGLENLESKIRRLGKYYVRNGEMSKGWKYSPEEARLIVQK